MVSGPWLSSSGAGRQSSGSGNRRLPQSALVSASVGCLRRKAALGLLKATACSEPQAAPRPAPRSASLLIGARRRGGGHQRLYAGARLTEPA